LPTIPRVATVWGPSLGVLGVLLWSFVVMGQLVTSYAPGKHGLLLGETTGALCVVGATAAAWLFAWRRSVDLSPKTGRLTRGIVLALVPLVGFVVVLVFAVTISGLASDGMITTLLLGMSGGMFAYGKRLSMRAPLAAPLTEHGHVIRRVLWAGVGALTFAALVALAAN
jgi:hypothetical protein